MTCCCRGRLAGLSLTVVASLSLPAQEAQRAPAAARVIRTALHTVKVEPFVQLGAVDPEPSVEAVPGQTALRARRRHRE